MNNLCVEIIAFINQGVNAVADLLLTPVMRLPNWLSCSLLSGVTGLIILVLYKYTSNQTAIKKIRSRIKANMLAMRLYKDSLDVTLTAQWQLFKGGIALLVNSLIPLAVMMLPMIMILAQLQSWYGYEPLAKDTEAIVTVQLDSGESLASVKIDSITGAHIVTGPVRIQTLNQAAWSIAADEDDAGNIIFDVNGEKFEKSLVTGERQNTKMSPLRPGRKFSDVLLYPAEKPFKVNSVVQSINVTYPQREWEAGITGSWIIDFFIMSCVIALLCKNIVKVSF